MPTTTLNCNKQTALKRIAAHTDTAQGGSKKFYGSIDSEGFTISLNNRVHNMFKVKAKGVIENNEEGGSVISFTFTQNILSYLFLAFIAIAVISLFSIMSFFNDGATLYAVQVLVVSVLGIVAILNYHYQVNKIMNAIEGLEGLK